MMGQVRNERAACSANGAPVDRRGKRNKRTFRSVARVRNTAHFLIGLIGNFIRSPRSQPTFFMDHHCWKKRFSNAIPPSGPNTGSTYRLTIFGLGCPTTTTTRTSESRDLARIRDISNPPKIVCNHSSYYLFLFACCCVNGFLQFFRNVRSPRSCRQALAFSLIERRTRSQAVYGIKLQASIPLRCRLLNSRLGHW